jgi:hypothetical protein
MIQDSLHVITLEDMIPKTPKPENPKSGLQSYAKNGPWEKKKKHFSQPWGGHFPRSNSRSTSTDPNISSGFFIISFGSCEGSQKSPAR